MQIQMLHKKREIRRFRGLHQDDVIFCLGTGPSLNQEMLQLLDDQIVICTNSAFKVLDRCMPKKAYWFVQDANRLRELQGVDRKVFAASFRSIHFLPAFETGMISKTDLFVKPTFAFRPTRRGILLPTIVDRGCQFSDDLSRNICLAGSSVIFSAIQLAAYMGASKIVLLGVDMHYTADAATSHFDGSDAGGRHHWVGPYETDLRPAFVEYNRLLHARGIDFINCTQGTREDVLRKASLKDVVSMLQGEGGKGA